MRSSLHGRGRLGEDRHDGVAYMLDHDPRSALGDRRLEHVVMEVAHLVGVVLPFFVRELRESDDVGEHDRQHRGVLQSSEGLDARDLDVVELERRIGFLHGLCSTRNPPGARYGSPLPLGQQRSR